MHCDPGKQVCAGAQICPGMQGVPRMGGSGVGIIPGVHCQPAAQIWPGWQTSPGMHIPGTDVLGLDGPEGGVVPGTMVHAARHTLSSKVRAHTRM